MSYQIVHIKHLCLAKNKRHKLSALFALVFFVMALAGCGKMPPAVDPPPEAVDTKMGGFPRHYPDIKRDPAP